MEPRMVYERNARHCIANMLEMREPPRVFAICTGAGAGLQRTLWSVPGISGALVGAAFPYDTGATSEILGLEPESFVSAEAAMGLAHAAYVRALASSRTGPAIGLGVTGSVASIREHRGDHRAWIAAVTPGETTLRCLDLPKGKGAEAREADDLAIEMAAFTAMLDVLKRPVTLGGIPVSQHGEERIIVTPELISDRTFFARPFFHANGTRTPHPSPTECRDLLLLPGTFNPLHDGHRGLAFEAGRVSGRRAVFAVTANPPHKDPMAVTTLLERVRAMRGHDLIFGLNDALFIDKARRYPGASFVIGADTLLRMLDPKWCPVLPMLAEFATLGTQFYVAGRVDSAGVFIDPHQIEIPSEYRGLFVAVPGRWDISSTALRTSAA